MKLLKKISPLLALTLITALYFVFSKFYLNDKATIAINLVELYRENFTITGEGLPCVTDSIRHLKSSWLEEPPLFHFAAVIIREIAPGFLYAKLLPLLCLIASSIGLLKLTDPDKTNTKLNLYLTVLIAAFTPIIYIHGVKFIPDSMAFTLTIWSLYFIKKDSIKLAFTLCVLAAITKVLCIFAFFVFFVGYLFYAPKRKTVLSRFALGTLFGTAIVPMLFWLYYIKTNNYDNPYFPVGELNFDHHTGGSDFSVLLSGKFIGRYLTFSITRGIGFVGALTLMVYFFKRGRKLIKSEDWFDKVMLVSLLLQPLYWIIIRSQTSEPWYTFHCIIPLIYFVIKGILSIENKKLRVIVALVHCALSISLVPYSTNMKDNFIDSIKDKYPHLSCDYFGKES
ncbi:MAG: hypothetical protein KAG61_01325 [Bacteriovoracaceae bacterium]|nr:hypothetical protein [Bacteriovoracaceae bacterium]